MDKGKEISQFSRGHASVEISIHMEKCQILILKSAGLEHSLM